MGEPVNFWLEAMRRGMGETPFLKALGGQIVEFAGGRGRMKLGWSEHLVGNPATGVVHGGVITAMLDHACGLAIGSALRTPMAMATLDLRIDYLKPAVPQQDLQIESHCLKITHEIAFARAWAFHETASDAVAVANAAFILMPRVTMRPEAATS